MTKLDPMTLPEHPARPRHARWPYPPARRSDTVDVYHGTAVPDPYRWLEDDADPDTRAWLAAQETLASAYLRRLPARARFHERLTELWDHARHGAPERRADLLVFQHNDGLQAQPILYRQRDGAAAEVLLDPNRLSDDGTTALVTTSLSRDGELLAYSLSEAGSDWQRVHALRTRSGEPLGDELHWCKFTGLAWDDAGDGFYYARYPAPGELPDAPPSTHQRVYYHRVGTPQGDDVLVYARPDAPGLGFHPTVSVDGRYLFLHAWDGTDRRNRVYYFDRRGDGEVVRLLDAHDAHYEVLGNDGPVLYLLTDQSAPNGRIVAIDLARPAPQHWRELVPEGDDAIAGARMVADRFVVLYLHHAQHRVALFERDGRAAGAVPLPGVGTVTELTGQRDDREAFLTFQSFLQPPMVVRVEVAAGGNGVAPCDRAPSPGGRAEASDDRSEAPPAAPVQSPRQDAPAGLGAPTHVFHQARVRFDPSRFETQQVFVASHDGVRLPVFLTHLSGVDLVAGHPTLLYGYGGFNVAMTPTFTPSRVAWLERGGVHAQAVLRGGSEYGERWHEGGMLERKQQVFDDFVAVAEWLIEAGYTRPERLAIEGRSNGGLLVAACLTQRPDLFGAVHCGVPVIDMLRYHRFTAGRYWIPEYGNAEADPGQFRTLLAYSPLHNLRPGSRYPPTLVTTADTDDRVVPLHARKFIAALQAADRGAGPQLLRVERAAGHGFGKPTRKLIDETSDVLAFLWDALTHGVTGHDSTTPDAQRG